MSFAEKFKTDFIKEARYTYLLKGLLNTVIIAFFAALMGVVIGFLIAVVRSNHDKNRTHEDSLTLFVTFILL